MFELKIGDTVINLKWGTYAMKLFCTRMGTGIDGFFELLQEIADGKATQDKMLQILESFLHAGYEYANKSKATDEQVCEWIDYSGGIVNINKGQMVDYVNYVISLTLTGITPLPGDTTDDKKKDE
jgi:hypothetical protein